MTADKRTKDGEIIITAKSEVRGKPYAPPDTLLSEAYALQSLERGEATPDQQIKALSWIINKCCGTYDLPYRPESSRDSDFAAGKMFVGQQIVKFIKTNLSIYKEEEDE